MKSPAPLGATQRELVSQHRPLACSVARRMWRSRRHLPYDDFVSSADLGLMQAAQGYVPDPERPFPPYAFCRIVGSVRDWLGHESKATAIRRAAIESGLAIAEHLGDDEDGSHHDDEAVTRDRLGDKAMAIRGGFLAGVAAAAHRAHGEDDLIERGAHRLAIEAVRAAITTLPERDRTIVERHYFGAEPLQAIGVALGVSYRSVRRFHEDALVRLGRRLSASGVDRAPLTV